LARDFWRKVSPGFPALKSLKKRGGHKPDLDFIEETAE